MDTTTTFPSSPRPSCDHEWGGEGGRRGRVEREREREREGGGEGGGREG